VSPLSRPPEAPGAFDHFPDVVLEPGAELVRIHRRGRSPWWFSGDGSGRFDLGPPAASPELAARGTCYLAEDPLGAFVEVFRDLRVIPEAEVRRRALSRIALPRALRLADATARRARVFGVTGALHSSPDYGLTRAWAAAFAGAGFDGVRYLVSHDPAQQLVGYALFGDRSEAGGAPPDEGAWPPGEAGEIGFDLLRRARLELGLHAFPAP
jgi:hypothetical protein